MLLPIPGLLGPPRLLVAECLQPKCLGTVDDIILHDLKDPKLMGIMVYSFLWMNDPKP